MSVTITSVLFSDEYTGLASGHGTDSGQNQLKGCVGDLMWVTIQGYVKRSVEALAMNFSSTAQTITIFDCSGVTSFISAGFQTGMTITVTGTGTVNDTTYTISTVSATVIKVTSGITVSGQYSAVSVFDTTSIVNGLVDFYANVVPNNYPDNSFASLTDINSTQRFSGSIPPISSTNTLTPNARSWAWWEGYDVNAGYYYGGTPLEPKFTTGSVDSTFAQNFTIVYPFFIKPFYTADQLQTMKDAYANSKYLNNGSPLVNSSTAGFTVPDYFQNDSCLKFIAQIDIRFNRYDKAPQHTSAGYVWPNGNTAWFNDCPVSSPDNADIPLYTLSSITYVDTLTSQTVQTLDYSRTTIVRVRIIDSGFHSGDPYVLNFMWLPTNANVYQNYNNKANPATFRTVFLHDRVYSSLAADAKNGDQYGSGYQVIKSATATLSGGFLNVVFTADFGQLAKNLFDSLDTGDLNFFIWVTPQDKNEHSLSAATRNAVMGDVNLAIKNTDNPTLFAISTDGTTDEHFFRFPNFDTNPVTNYAGVVGDFTYSKIGFKVSGRTKSIRTHFDVSVFDDNSNLVSTFTIEDWSANVADSFDGKTNQIDISQSRGFALPDGDLRNAIIIQRDASLDSGAYYGFKMTYGFQLGFKFWNYLTTFAQEFVDYPAQYWAVFTQGGTGGTLTIPNGYSSSIAKITEWVITDTATGIDTPFSHSSTISVNDQYAEGTLPTLTISTADIDGNNMNGSIASDVQTKILVDCFGNGDTIGTPPAPYTGFVVELSAFYDNGDAQVYDYSNSEVANLPSSLWVGQPTYTVVSPTEVTIQGIFDPTLSPTPITSVRIIAKIGYKK